MLIFRTIVHGHILELRRDHWGRENTLVNGVEVSYKPFNCMFPRPHFFSIKDEQSRPRHVEARTEARTWSVRGFNAYILVDGVERARLDPLDTSRPIDICANCGYNLIGIPVENSERRCPECGRHSISPDKPRE